MNRADAEEIQRQRRRTRAREGRFPVTPLSGPQPEGRYGVRSESGFSYEVEVLAARGRRALCSCPDFQTNTLGTCKHVEAVFLFLKRRDPRGLAEAEARLPEEARVYLDLGEETRVRLLRSRDPSPALQELADLYFDAEGFFIGEPWRDFGGFARAAAEVPGLRIDADAYAHVRRLRHHTGQVKRLRRRLRDLDEGRELDVTRLPLHPFQQRGALHLAMRERAVLADEIGLGKTAQAIAAAELLRREEGIRRILVVCPASAAAHWSQEIERFTGEVAARIQGTPEQRRDQYLREARYTLVHDELLVSDQEELERLAPELVILDAAQRIRDWRSRTAQVLKRLRTRFSFVLVDAALEEDLDQLYSVLQLVDQRLLGPLWRFNGRYFEFREGEPPRPRNLEELRERIAPVVLRRRLDEVADQLPGRVSVVHRLPLPFVTWSRVREQTEKLRGLSRRTRLFLRQLGQLRALGDCLEAPKPPKLEELAAILQDALPDASGGVVVVACGARLLERAAATLGERGVKVLGRGSPSPGAGEVLLALDPDLPGLDLSAATLQVELDVPWSPADWRTRRSTAPRRSLTLVAEGSLEDTLHALLEEAPDLLERLALEGEGEAPEGQTRAAASDWAALLTPRDHSPPPRRKPRPPPEALPLPSEPPRSPGGGPRGHQGRLFGAGPRPSGPESPEGTASPGPTQGSLFPAPDPGGGTPPPGAPSPGDPPPRPTPQLLHSQLAPVLGEKLIAVHDLGGGWLVEVKDNPERLRGTIRALSRGLGIEPLVLDTRTAGDLRPLLVHAPPPPDLESVRGRLEAARALLATELTNECLTPLVRALTRLREVLPEGEGPSVPELERLGERARRAREAHAAPIPREEVEELMARVARALEAATLSP